MNSRKGLSEEAYLQMLACEWKGNIRDLRNALRRGNALCDGAVIQARHLDLAPATEKEKEETEAVYRDGGTADDVLKRHALEVLKQNGNNVKATAKALGVGYSTLRRYLRKWGVDAGE